MESTKYYQICIGENGRIAMHFTNGTYFYFRSRKNAIEFMEEMANTIGIPGLYPPVIKESELNSSAKKNIIYEDGINEFRKSLGFPELGTHELDNIRRNI